MTWRLRIVHSTGFAYTAPAYSSFNEARLTPRSDSRQSVIVSRVETTPPTREYRYTDYWGTAVTSFDLHAPHRQLEVRGVSVVETDPASAPDPNDLCGWDDLKTTPVIDRFDEFLRATDYVPASKRLTSVAKRLVSGRSPEEAITAVCRWVYDQMEYMPGTTSVHTSAMQAYKTRKGVCQDYAHLSLLLLRSVGVPARYVSGYLHPDPGAQVGTTVQGQSHAWVEGWAGLWLGYDPTNDVPIGERHVTVGVGRDYADVAPLKGVYIGGGATDLDVVVDITRLA